MSLRTDHAGTQIPRPPYEPTIPKPTRDTAGSEGSMSESSSTECDQ